MFKMYCNMCGRTITIRLIDTTRFNVQRLVDNNVQSAN